MNCKLWIANLCEKSDINGLIGRMELQEYYNAPEAFERGCIDYALAAWRLRPSSMKPRRSLHAVKVYTAHRMKNQCFLLVNPNQQLKTYSAWKGTPCDSLFVLICVSSDK